MKQTPKKSTLACGALLLLVMGSGPVQAEWQWSPAVTTLSQEGQQAGRVRLSANSIGDVTSIWFQEESTDSWRVQGSRYSISDDQWGVSVGISGAGHFHGLGLATVIDTWAIWSQEQNQGGSVVQAALYKDGGWNTPINLSVAGQETDSPEIVGDAHGTFTAVWRNSSKSANGAVIQRAQYKNGLWGNPVDMSEAGQYSTDPILAGDPQGDDRLTVLWRNVQEGGSWAVQSLRYNGLNWGTIENVMPHGKYVTDLGATNADTDVFAVWVLHNGDSESLIQSAYWHNGVWSNPTTLSPQGKVAFLPAIAGNSYQVTAVWVVDDAEEFTIQSSRFENGNWGPIVDLGKAGPRNAAHEGGWPQVAAGLNDHATAIWQQVSNESVIVKSARFSTGQWGAPVTVANAGSTNAYPKIVDDGVDRVTAAWLNNGVLVSKRGYDMPPAQQFSITLVKSGDGVVTSIPNGIDCGSTCNASFTKGQLVTLRATPGPGQIVGGWSGDCAQYIGPPSESCNLTMNGNKRASVAFRSADAKTRTVNALLKGKGKGGVTSDPAGITCSNDPEGSVACNAQIAEFEQGSSVTMTANAVPGSHFSGWAGACKGKNPICTFRVGKQKSVLKVIATFKPNPTLTVQKKGGGEGSVRSDNGAINCGSTCSATFESRSVVSLTAEPRGGSYFAGWGGACTGQRELCRVTLSKSKTVTATFKKTL